MSTSRTPAISILLPTYNGETFLAELLDSILSQSWADFELLIIDDGSQDTTPALLQGYARRDKRIKLLRSSGNRGQRLRLAQLLNKARGPLIAISDQDDIWDRYKLERLARHLNGAALAFGRSELIDESGVSLKSSLLETVGAVPHTDDRLSLLFRPQVSGHSMLVRREATSPDVFEALAPYDWLISIVCRFWRGIVHDDQAVVFHRIHGSNLSNSDVILRLDKARLRPRHFAEWLARGRARRARFIEGLSYLASNSLVSEADRVVFGKVASMCRAAWIDMDRPVSSWKLRRKVLELLHPLAGSPRDYRIAEDHMTALAFGPLHPVTLLRLRRLL